MATEMDLSIAVDTTTPVAVSVAGRYDAAAAAARRARRSSAVPLRRPPYVRRAAVTRASGAPATSAAEP